MVGRPYHEKPGSKIAGKSNCDSPSSTYSRTMNTKHRVTSEQDYRKKVRCRLEGLAALVPGGRKVIETLDALQGSQDESFVSAPTPSLEALITISKLEDASKTKVFLTLCSLFFKNHKILTSLSLGSTDVLNKTDDDSLLETAVKLDCAGAIPLLLRGIDPKTSGQFVSDGISQAVILAVEANRVTALGEIYNCGFSFERIIKSGKALLHIAVELKSNECLEFLLKTKLNPNSLDYANLTPLITAARFGNNEAVNILLRSGADVNKVDPQGRSALHNAADRGDVLVVEKLVRVVGNIDARDEKKYSPLIMACAGGYNNIVKILLDSGADVNQCDRFSPLHAAARGNHVKLVGLLLRRGADLSLRNWCGETALHWLGKYCPKALTEFTDILDESIAFGDDTNETESYILNFKPLFFNRNSREMSLVMSLTSLGYYDIMNHPLCEAFINLKWQKVTNWVMYSFVCIYVVYLTLLFIYVDHMVTSKNSKVGSDHDSDQPIGKDFVRAFLSQLKDLDKSTETPFSTEFKAGKDDAYGIVINGTISWQPEISHRYVPFGPRLTYSEGYIQQPGDVDFDDDGYDAYFLVRVFLLLIASMFLVVECFQFLTNPYLYFRDMSNYLSLINISLTIILCSCASEGVDESPEYVNHIAAVLVLFSSWEMMLVLAYIPLVGIYVQMFFKAVTNVLFFMLTFLVLVFGFGLALASVFGTVQFGRFPFYVITTYVMMAGELDYKGLFFEDSKVQDRGGSDPSPYTLSFLLLGFILVVVLTLMNLLIGLAVSDTHSIHETAVTYNATMKIRRLHLIEQTLIYSRFLPLQRIKQRFFRRCLLFPWCERDSCIVDTQDQKWQAFKLPKDIQEKLRQCKLNYVAKMQQSLELKVLKEREAEYREILRTVRDLKSYLTNLSREKAEASLGSSI